MLIMPCCAAQGSLVAGHYKVVNTGSELLDQLANTTARYIGVGSSLSLPANLGMRRVTVSRYVRRLRAQDIALPVRMLLAK